MNYLKKYFDKDVLNYLKFNIPAVFKEEINNEEKIVVKNIETLKKLNISNIDEIFKNYYDMFLMDPSMFFEIFDKYDQDDLIDKLNKNIAIIEYL